MEKMIEIGKRSKINVKKCDAMMIKGENIHNQRSI